MLRLRSSSAVPQAPPNALPGARKNHRTAAADSRLFGGIDKRTRVAAAIAVSLLAIGVVSWLVAWSHKRAGSDGYAGPNQVPSHWVVSGASMVPTLLGPSVPANCSFCRLHCRVESAAINAASDKVLCSHCGRPLTIDRSAASPNQADVDADIVAVVSDKPVDRPARGSLIAATDDQSKWFVKRLVGLPGDTIDMHEDGMHLTLNGRRIEDVLFETDDRFPLPRFLVDNDRSRHESRWSSFDDGESWRRNLQRTWRRSVGADKAWLVYSHVSVYDQNRPSAVLDDYQYNATLTRTLQPVDRFLLSGRCQCTGTAKLDIAFWSVQHSVIASLEVHDGKKFETSFYQALPSDGLPVSAHRPVAIRVSGASVALSSLTIHRLVEYRLRPRADRCPYPLRIGADEVFVLGDNVPVSVDSRDFGSLSTDHVIGTVDKATP